MFLSGLGLGVDRSGLRSGVSGPERRRAVARGLFASRGRRLAGWRGWVGLTRWLSERAGFASRDLDRELNAN